MTYRNRVQRTGPPSSASRQRQTVITMLREAGTNGVSRKLFIDPNGLAITQVSARLAELETMGYEFSSRFADKHDGYVTYYLETSPLVELPLEPKKKTIENCPHCGHELPEFQRRSGRLRSARHVSSSTHSPAPVNTVSTVLTSVTETSSSSTASTSTHNGLLFDMTQTRTWHDPEQDKKS